LEANDEGVHPLLTCHQSHNFPGVLVCRLVPTLAPHVTAIHQQYRAFVDGNQEQESSFRQGHVVGGKPSWYTKAFVSDLPFREWEIARPFTDFQSMG
jgi:hypothetical protein